MVVLKRNESYQTRLGCLLPDIKMKHTHSTQLPEGEKEEAK
jgi:hypothetical protein